MNNADVGARATEVVDLFIEAVEQIPSESWDLPSNLEGWSIGDLVAHSTGSAAKIVTLVEGGQVAQGPADPDDWRKRGSRCTAWRAGRPTARRPRQCRPRCAAPG